MGWGDPDELVELHGASGKTWQLQFVKQIWPKVDTPDAASTVYMMKEVGKGKMFVAKTQFADTPEEFEDLVAEAAAWRKINVAHQNQWPPHIVELQDVFITRGADSSVVYLMELCQKGNLPRKLPDDKVLEVIKAITEGVKSVMESGLPLHGNISYANALVTGANVVKLGGFGAGRAFVFRSYPNLSSKDDTFAIGKLAFELVVGRAPSGSEIHLPIQIPVGDHLRMIIDTALLPPDRRPDVMGLMAMLSGRQGMAPMNGRPPQAPNSQNRANLMESVHAQQSVRGLTAGLSQPGAQFSVRGRAPIIDSVNVQNSVRGLQPTISQSSAQFSSAGKRSSMADVFGGQQEVSTAQGDMSAAPGQRRFRSMDPFGLATKKPSSGEALVQTEKLITAATDGGIGPMDVGSLRKLIDELKEQGNAPDIYRILFKRPISTDPIIAFKSVALIHLLMVEGSLEFIDMTLRQTKFIEWIVDTWSVEKAQNNVEKHKYTFAFLNGEISKYASFIRMKALFHYKTAYAFNGDWSRSDMLGENGEDPVKGRERKIISGLADVVELAEESASLLFIGNDPCRIVKVLPIPLLVTEVVHAYEAVRLMTSDVTNLNTRKKFVPAFDRCHMCARNVLEAVKLSHELSAKVPQDMLTMMIEETPPDILAEPSPEEDAVDLTHMDEAIHDEEYGSDAGTRKEKKKKKKKKKEKEAEDADAEEVDAVVGGDGQADAGGAEVEGAPANPEGGVLVPFEENKIGLLVRYNTEHDEEPIDEEVVQRAENPNIGNASLLADILGEAPQQDEGYDGAGGNQWALVLTEEAREEERAVLREARERSAAYSMALTVVGDAPVFEKTHPAFCQCMMCQTTTSVQNMTVYGAEDSDEDVNADTVKIEDETEVPEKYQITAKDVKLGTQIGEGAFGSVFKAKYKRKEVAVKKIPKELLQNEAVLTALKREVVLMCHLEHPNVMKLVGASTKRSNFLIVLEYMTRGSLFDMIHKARARLNWPIIKRLAASTAAGMAYLHSSKILHRDLKSSNIMVDADFSVKIGDFGIAVILSGEEQDGSHHKHGFAGTYQYMAPEIIAGQPYTEKSDVYSFAIVLWEMVSMQLPFYGMDPTAAANQVLQGGLRPHIPQFCPQPVAVLISSCWNQEPTLRPSFKQIGELIKRIPG